MNINITLIGQMITFLILVAFTMKYVWPPIIKAMREREKRIAAGLEMAERSKRELEMAEHKAIEIIKDAKLETQRIIEQAHKRAGKLVEEAKDAARLEGKLIIEAAQKEIEREVAQTREELKEHLAKLAIRGAEKILVSELDASRHTAVLNELVAEI